MFLFAFVFLFIYTTYFPAETMTNADYVDDLVLLANTPAQAESGESSRKHWSQRERKKN